MNQKNQFGQLLGNPVENWIAPQKPKKTLSREFIWNPLIFGNMHSNYLMCLLLIIRVNIGLIYKYWPNFAVEWPPL